LTQRAGDPRIQQETPTFFTTEDVVGDQNYVVRTLAAALGVAS
jgi:hypothetical protein